MKKTITIILMLLALHMQAQMSITYEDLKNIIASVNASMPMPMGPTMTINTVALNDNRVVYKGTVVSGVSEGGFIKPETLEQNIADMASNNESLKLFTKILIDLDCGMTFDITMNPSGEHLVVDLSPEILKSSLNRKISPADKLRIILESQRQAFPIQIAPGLKIVDMVVSDGFFEWVYEIDETLYDVDEMEANKEVTRQTMPDVVKNDGVCQQQLIIVDENGLGLKCTYKGNITGTTFSISWTNAEMKDQLMK